MIAASNAFSLFSAYQFLIPDRAVLLPKQNATISIMCVPISALMMEMIAQSFFFAYCVSNFEC